MKVKEGYEGIFVALAMLAIVLVVVGVARWISG
jgi:hypothetical protein